MTRIARADTRLQWRRRARPLLGTLVEIAILADADDDDPAVAALIARMFDRIAVYQRAMSFHEPASDVQAIVRAEPGETLVVCAETWSVLQAALALEVESDGAFCIAVAPTLVDRGLLPAPATRRTRGGLAGAASAALELKPGRRVAVIRPIWIDLGGIAKGAAVDAAIAVARDSGATGASVDAGGDSVLFGATDRTIELVAPDRSRVTIGALGDGAIAASGPFGDGGRNDLVATTHAAHWADRSLAVVAPTCLLADALTKVLAVRGRDAAAILRRHDARGFSVDHRCRVETVA